MRPRSEPQGPFIRSRSRTSTSGSPRRRWATTPRSSRPGSRQRPPSQAPYDLAQTIVTDLQDPANFTYATDVRDLDCAAISTVECFATYKKGFCQYYAPTMAVLLRDMGVPTRMVEGFLPGAVDPHTGIETIPFSSAHAWVEVYFPVFGWVMFDPTGGNLSQPVAAGASAAAPSGVHSAESRWRGPDACRHGKRRLGPALPGRCDGGRGSDRRDARPGHGRGATRRRRRGRRRDAWAGCSATPDKVEFVPLGDTPVGVGEPIDPTKNPPLFGGDQIASATMAADQNGAPAVDFLLKPDGTRLFADYTANHIGSYFAITMDGDVLSAPVIQNAIPNGDIQISGGGLDGLDATHAHGLVALIGSGELPVPLELTSSSVIGLPSPAASTP